MRICLLAFEPGFYLLQDSPTTTSVLQEVLRTLMGPRAAPTKRAVLMLAARPMPLTYRANLRWLEGAAQQAAALEDYAERR